MSRKKIKKQNNKKKGLKNILVNIFLVLMLIVGLALIFNNQIKYFLIGLNSNQYHTSKISADDVEKNKKIKGNFNFDEVESLSTEAVLRAQMDKQKLPVIGGIAIPELDLNLPIFKGVSNTNLILGAGTMKEDQEMGKGNYALASHHVSGQPNMLFSVLKEGPAKPNQRVYLTDKTNIYEYVIYSVFEVTPEHVEVIDDNGDEKMLTLITCNDLNAEKRVVVQAKLEKQYPVGESSKAVKKAFKKPYNQLS